MFDFFYLKRLINFFFLIKTLLSFIFIYMYILRTVKINRVVALVRVLSMDQINLLKIIFDWTIPIPRSPFLRKGRKQTFESFYKESKWFLEKLIHNISNSDNLMNSRRGLCKKPWSNTVIYRFLQGFQLHTWREDGTNSTSLWSSQRNHCSHNEAL